MEAEAAAIIRDDAPSRTAALTVRRLALGGFRNYARLGLELGPEPVVLIGPNGAGKTNLLEAVSLLAPGRGLRRAALAELDRDGDGPWWLQAVAGSQAERAEIATFHDPEQPRRQIRIDGQPLRRQDELAALVSVVWLVPAMDRLFTEAAASRRRFLDRLTFAIHPGHASQVARYERAMRQRSRLLRDGTGDAAWLSALERRMAEPAVAIAAARRELVRGLNELLRAPDLEFPALVLDLAGDVEAWLESGMSALDAEQALIAALAGARPQDGRSGGAAHGPHRSDLLVHDAGSGEPAARASTGRQKAMLLAITLAEARLRRLRHGDLPILLLDEVAAHLDGERRAQLCRTLYMMGAQAWLTGTDEHLFRGLFGHAQFFRIDEGRLARHE